MGKGKVDRKERRGVGKVGEWGWGWEGKEEGG